MTNNGPESFNVAVVGGGIVGLHVALGLLKRNIPTTVFERTTQFREIGAGLGFPKVAVECMRALDPRIADAFDRIAVTGYGRGMASAMPSPWKIPQRPHDFDRRLKTTSPTPVTIAASSTGSLRWADGYTKEDIRLRSRPHDYEVTAGGPDSFPGCHRAQLLDGLVALAPPEALKLNKELDDIEDRGPDEELLLRFRDGTTAEADVVIGCDGIKSRVRRVVVGDAPAAHPHYSHQVSYRALLDMGQAVAAVGDIVRDQLMYMGPGAHINTYPVAGHTMVNVVAFVRDLDERGGVVGGGVSVAKGDVFETFAGWSPVVRALVALLPDRVDSWAIYDTHDHPLSTHAHGRIALAGDAPWAASPHHGAGASMGVEDALCLATALAEAAGSLRDAPAASRHEAIAAAIRAYDAVRRERTQWLVRSSRAVVDMFQQSGAEGGRDGFQTELSERSHRIWNFDWQGMVRQRVDTFYKEQ